MAVRKAEEEEEGEGSYRLWNVADDEIDTSANRGVYTWKRSIQCGHGMESNISAPVKDPHESTVGERCKNGEGNCRSLYTGRDTLICCSVTSVG